MKKFLLTIEVDEEEAVRNMETNGLKDRSLQNYVAGEISGWLEASGIRVISNYPADSLNTDAGEITLIPYDDRIARGVQILLEGEVTAMLDVHNDDGEARVLIYKSSEDEPFCDVTVNR